MVTEGGAHVVVNLEPVWHVNVEAFFLELEGKGITGQESYISSPPTLYIIRSITGFHQDLGNPKVQGAQGRVKERRKEVKKEAPPSDHSPDPMGPAHDGVPAIGGSASAAADDLVNAFLVDGSIAFLKGHRPRTGRGRHQERQSLSWHCWPSIALCTKPAFSLAAHTLTLHRPQPRALFFPPPASSSRRGLESTGQEMGQSKGLWKIEKAQ